MRTWILIAFAFLTTASSAQEELYKSSLQEALLKKSNKIWYIRTLNDSLIVDKGIIVYADGRVKATDGREYILADGDCIKFKGQLIVMYQWKRDDDGIIFKKRVVKVWSILTQPTLLQNGIYALPSGDLKMPSGNYVKMKNNDFVSSDGTLSTAIANK